MIAKCESSSPFQTNDPCQAEDTTSLFVCNFCWIGLVQYHFLSLLLYFSVSLLNCLRSGAANGHSAALLFGRLLRQLWGARVGEC